MLLADARRGRVYRGACILNLRKFALLILFAVFATTAFPVASGGSEDNDATNLRRLEQNLGLAPFSLNPSSVRRRCPIANYEGRPHRRLFDAPSLAGSRHRGSPLRLPVFDRWRSACISWRLGQGVLPLEVAQGTDHGQGGAPGRSPVHGHDVHRPAAELLSTDDR